MADEYIRKEDAIKQCGFGMTSLHIANNLRKMPPADVVPVVHAYWIPQKENHEFKEAWMKCSACGYPVSKWTGNTNFCPNCGAIMDAKEKG